LLPPPCRHLLLFLCDALAQVSLVALLLRGDGFDHYRFWLCFPLPAAALRLTFFPVDPPQHRLAALCLL
jgi:hypothetical protein